MREVTCAQVGRSPRACALARTHPFAAVHPTCTATLEPLPPLAAPRSSSPGWRMRTSRWTT